MDGWMNGWMGGWRGATKERGKAEELQPLCAVGQIAHAPLLVLLYILKAMSPTVVSGTGSHSSRPFKACAESEGAHSLLHTRHKLNG